jgi:hypothetical protein
VAPRQWLRFADFILSLPQIFQKPLPTTTTSRLTSEIGFEIRFASDSSRLPSFLNRTARFATALRAAMISRFPYVILFEQVDEAVVILGVFHAASDCEGWFERKT